MGRVADFLADSVRVFHRERSFNIALADVASYSTSKGNDPWKGARLGAYAGAAVGAVLITVGAIADRRSDDLLASQALFEAKRLPVFIILGAGTGALLSRERWSPKVQMQR